MGSGREAVLSGSEVVTAITQTARERMKARRKIPILVEIQCKILFIMA
jgi:hypothetical protein